MTRSVAIEGLPGAGKTTLVESLHRLHPDVPVLREVVLPAPGEPSREFFARNDEVKAGLCAAHDSALMDRFWASTVAYVTAEERMAGAPTTLQQVTESLYGELPSTPTACVFLDSDRALTGINATDGLFPDPRFRRLLRSAYFEILMWLGLPTLVVRDQTASIAAFVAHHLSQAHEDSPLHA